MRAFTVALGTVLVALAVDAAPRRTVPLQNWSVPRPAVNAALSGPTTFVAVDPCRIVDTRFPPGPYAGPAMSAGMTRTFNIPGGPCSGVPAAAAYSLNFTIVNFAAGGGFITAFPSGSTRPGVSTVPFGPNSVFAVSNAAIVPANGAGSIDVYASDSTQLIIDINGYFAAGGGSGTITGVTAGPGLTGGGTSGTVALNVDFAGSGVANTAARSDHSHFVNLALVTGGPNAITNGTRLRTAVSSGATLIFIEPGTFDLGAAKLLVPPMVRLAGSGQRETFLTCSDTETLELQQQGGVNDNEVSSMTISNTNATGGKAVAAPQAIGRIKIERADISVSGGSLDSYGVWVDGTNAGIAKLILASLHIDMGGGMPTGLRLWGSTYEARAITITGNGRFKGLDDELGGPSTIDGISITATGVPAIGMFFGLQSTPVINNATIHVTGNAFSCGPMPSCSQTTGIVVSQTNSIRTLIRNSSIIASATGANAVGIEADVQPLFGVVASEIAGDTYAVSPGASRGGLGFPGVSYFQACRLRGSVKAIDDPGCGFAITSSVVDGGATTICSSPATCTLSVTSGQVTVDASCN